ncbi:MAG: helix-turn-helix domain-containing protein [Myxococcota bacterium]
MNPSDWLTTTDAAALAGVAASTIKRWADQGALAFSRTAGGHRRFERAAVEQLLRDQAVPSAQDDSALDRWVQCLVDGRRYEVEAQLLSARGRLGRWCEVGDEVAEALREIGRRWESGAISIADEHVASDCLARALARVGDMMPTGGGGPRCLLACAGDDEHSLGLTLAEPCLREHGWTPVWLGRRTPVGELARLVAEGRAELVAMTASPAHHDADALAALAAEVGSHCKKAKVALVLGGSGPWPAAPAYGTRLSSLVAFSDYLTAFPTRRSSRR